LIGTAGWAVLRPSPVRVEVAEALHGAMQVSVDNQGQVRVHDKYSVDAPVPAELERVELHDGDPVRRGQLVAVLRPLPMDQRQTQEATARADAAAALAREAALRVQRAETELQLARRERERVDKLVAEHFISAQAADKASAAEQSARAERDAAMSRSHAAAADVRAARAAVAAADTSSTGQRRLLRLLSPADGYVLKVNEKSTRTVAAGTVLVTIGNPDKYEIVVDVLSTDAVKIKPGDTMLLDGWGGNGVLRATVRLVEPVAFTKVSALGIDEQRVNVVGDPVDSLLPLGDGYRVEARIVIWSASDVLKIPASSLFRRGDAWHVFVDRQGRAHEVAVEPGHRNQHEAEILSGLTQGAVILRFPGNQINEGVRIMREPVR
jgi:HlyD family secretion protein